MSCGASIRIVAGDLGLASTVVTRAADDLITPGDLQPLLQGMAADFGLVGRTEFPFLLGVGAKVYRPDCVWFDGKEEVGAMAAIFEIEVGTSPKHRAGGIAFAKFVALSGRKRLWFFAVSRGANQTVTANTVELFARLGEKWQLDAVVVPSFSPALIRARVRAALAAREASSPATHGA